MGKGKTALGVLIGVAAGAVAGIMTAPKSGKETREDIKNKANELKHQADSKKQEMKSKAEHAKGDATGKAKDLRERTEKAAKSVKQAYTEDKSAASKRKR